MLQDAKRTASVIVKRRCEMLELTSFEFKQLIRSKSEVVSQIEKIAKTRLDLS